MYSSLSAALSSSNADDLEHKTGSWLLRVTNLFRFLQANVIINVMVLTLRGVLLGRPKVKVLEFAVTGDR